jgi:hypothetical protein
MVSFHHLVQLFTEKQRFARASRKMANASTLINSVYPNKEE